MNVAYSSREMNESFYEDLSKPRSTESSKVQRRTVKWKKAPN